MGANTKQLRNRIKSVDSTLHLTRAMGLVASSKLRRTMENMNKGRQYEAAVRGPSSRSCTATNVRPAPI